MSDANDIPTPGGSSSVGSTSAEEVRLEPGSQIAAVQRQPRRGAIDTTNHPLHMQYRGDNAPESHIPKTLREKIETDIKKLQDHANRIDKRLDIYWGVIVQVQALATSSSERVAFLLQQVMELQARMDKENAQFNGNLGNTQTTVSQLVASDANIRARLHAINQRMIAIEQRNMREDYTLQQLSQVQRPQGPQGH